VALVKEICEVDTKVLPEELKGNQLEDLGINEYIVLKEIEPNFVDLVHFTDSMVELAYSCECINEPSGTVKDGEFLDKLNEYDVLQKA
jgi:hypothetical protein